MAFPNPSSKVPFSISGTGDAVGVFRFFGINVASAAAGGAAVTGGGTTHNGRVTYVYIRQEAGGGASEFDLKVVDRDLAVSTSTVYANIPDDYVIIEAPAVTSTASATDASLDSPLDAPPTYQSSLAIVVDVTAVGAWTLLGYLTLER